MAALKNKKHEAFCQEYMVDRNAAAAARRAGYAERNARSMGYQILQREDIKDRITELEQAYARSVKLDVEKVLIHYAQIATADPRELTSFRRHACRYCHGHGHKYQWRTEEEFREACDLWKATPENKRGFPPEDVGGYGYTKRLDPVESCTRCDGEGALDLVLPDTANISPAAAKLFAGIKETRNGIEIKMHDQMAALDAIARHLNLFKADNDERAKDGLAAMLAAISSTGSAAPIREEGEEIQP